MAAATTRTTPHPPSPDEWAAAARDYDLGRVTTIVLSVSDATVEVTATAAWLRAWQRTPMTPPERGLVRAACAQIARDRVHPSLGVMLCPVDPAGDVWMAAPAPQVTLTWRAHWSSPQVPVLMTLGGPPPD